MNLYKIKNRNQAFLVHIGISAVIVGVFLFIMLLFWYPGFYFKADGGWRVLKILLFVDLCLGPLLTLIVFKPGKPGLKFDITAIIVMQLIALFYGGHVIYKSRPAFLVYVVDRFNIISRTDIADKLDDIRYPKIREAAERGDIVVVFANLPKGDEVLQIAIDAVTGGFDVEGHPKFYEPYQDNLQAILKRGLDAREYMKLKTAAEAREIESFLEARKLEHDSVLFYPVVGKNKDLLLAANRENGNLVGYIDINPWIQSETEDKQKIKTQDPDRTAE